MQPGIIDEAWKSANSVLDSVNRVVPPRQRAVASFLVAIAFLILYRFVPDRSILGTAGALLILAMLNTLMLRVRSRIATGKTAAFLIARKHLHGRDEDIRRLVRIIESNPLVFLTGESGSGKSALLEQGVVPALASDPALVAVFVDNWGADWVQGPELALEIALRRTLNEDDLMRCGWIPGQNQGPASVLERMKLILGRTPVLIFDQFDDYQAQHRARFVRRSVVISAGALRRANSFWSSIATMLDRRLIRCLFATRDDTSLQLESVRFCRPSPYILLLADALIARDLVAEIAIAEAVEQPDNGWNQLIPRILRDLEVGHSGRILPIQMVRAFQGLIELPYLTIRDYERTGGLSGVEASYLQSRLKEVTQVVGWDGANLLVLLSSFIVDNKTTHQAEADLLAALPAAARDAAKLHAALELLEQHKIVRRVISPKDQGLAWRLDHDYIRYSIRELVRRMNRLEEELRDAQARWEAAYGLWRKFRTLLSPGCQIRLFWEALRGRFSYGPTGRFARWSAVRLVLNTWIAALMAVGILWAFRVDNQAREQARDLLRRSDAFYSRAYGDTKWTEWDKNIWTIANSSLRVRRWIFRETLSDMEANENESLLSDTRTYTISLIFGLSLDLRRNVAEPVLKERCNVNTKLPNGLLAACTSWLSALGYAPGWEPHFLLLQMYYHQDDLDQRFEGLAVELAGLENAPEAAVFGAGQMLVKRLSLPQTNPLLPGLMTNPADYPQQTVAALTLLAKRLSKDNREACAAFLRDKLSGARTWQERSRIAEALRPFAGDEPLYQAVEKTIQEMKGLSQSDLINVAPELCSVSSELRSKVAANLVDIGNVQVIQAVTDKCFSDLAAPDAEKLAVALGTLVQDPQILANVLATLNPPALSSYRPVAARLADAICNQSGGQLDSLADSLAVLGSRAPDDLISKAGKCLGQAIQRQMKAGPRAQTVHTRGGKVIPAMSIVVDQRWSDVEKLTNALVALGPRINADAEEIAPAVIDAFAKTPDDQLWQVAPIMQKLEPVTKISDLERFGLGISDRLRNSAVGLDTLARLFDKRLDRRVPTIVDSASAVLLQRFRDAAVQPNAIYNSGVTDDPERIVDALLALPRVPNAVAAEVVEFLLRWYSQTADEQRSSLTAAIFRLARSSDPRVQTIAFAYYDASVKHGGEYSEGASLDRAAELMGPGLRHKLLLSTVAFLKNIPVPQCDLAAPLASAEDLPVLFDMLKWPTCRDSLPSEGGHSARSLLVGRVSEFLGLSNAKEQLTPSDSLTSIPATMTPNAELTFLKAAGRWAKQNRYNLATPVSRPLPSL